MTEGLVLALAAAVFFGPLVHVAVSPRAGSWRPPAGARCPLGPRVGWLVLVALTGPLGWLLFLARRRQRARARGASSGRPGSSP